MRRAWLTVRALATAFVVSMPVWADAPVSGKDAQYAAFDSSSATITDNFTKLKWTRAPGDKVNFDTAKGKCTGSVRLPSLKELLTIFDEQPFAYYNKTAYEDRYVDQSAFGVNTQTNTERTPAGAFWTSSVAELDGSQVWTVDFRTGTVNETDATASGWVRCVDAL